MKRVFWFVVVGMLSVFLFTPGCTTEPQKTDAGDECKVDNDCWKKVCPQTNQVDFDLCVKEKLNHKDGPKYQLCTADNKCSEPDAKKDNFAGGTVNVQLKILPPGLKYSFLSLYVFPSKDLDGKKIDCARLNKAMSEPTAADNLMNPTLGRYYGERTDTGPFLYPVSNMSNVLPLLFQGSKGDIGIAPPGKGYVFVVQGFCNVDERPDGKTKPRHFACKEGVELKGGMDTNTINMELPIKPGESCFQ